MVERDAYSVDEACQRLGICRVTYYILVKTKALRTFLIGRNRKTTPAAIAEYIQAREAEPAPLGKSTRKSSTGESND